MEKGDESMFENRRSYGSMNTNFEDMYNNYHWMGPYIGSILMTLSNGIPLLVFVENFSSHFWNYSKTTPAAVNCRSAFSVVVNCGWTFLRLIKPI